MVLQFELEVIFPLSAQQYLQDRFTHQFRRFLAKENKALRISLIDSWEEDGKVLIKQTTSPDVAAWIPANYASYVKYYTDSIEYHDLMEFPATMTLPYTIRVRAKPAFTDTVATDNTLIIHAIDDTSCRQVLHSTITCNIVGIGGFVESYLRDSLERIYAGYAQVMAKWVQHREALLREPDMHPELAIARPEGDLVMLALTFNPDGSAQVRAVREERVDDAENNNTVQPLTGTPVPALAS